MMPWVIAKEGDAAANLRNSPLSDRSCGASHPRCAGRGPVLAAQKAPSPIGRRNMLQELQEVSSPSWRALPHSVPRSLWPTASCTFPALSQQDTTEKLSLYDTMEGIYTEFWQVAECGVPDSVSLDRSAEIDLSHEFPPEQREAQVDQALFYHRRRDDQSEA